MNKISIVVIIAVFGSILLAGTLYMRNPDNPISSVRPTGVTETNKDNLQLQTFSLDELGEPLDENNLPEAVDRNEARMDDIDGQIDEDLLFLDELNESLNDVEDGGISQ